MPIASWATAPSSPPPSKPLTVRAIANRTGNSVRTVRWWISHGIPTESGQVRLKANRVGRCWLVPAEEWDRFTAARESPSAPPPIDRKHARAVAAIGRAFGGVLYGWDVRRVRKTRDSYSVDAGRQWPDEAMRRDLLADIAPGVFGEVAAAVLCGTRPNFSPAHRRAIDVVGVPDAAEYFVRGLRDEAEEQFRAAPVAAAVAESVRCLASGGPIRGLKLILTLAEHVLRAGVGDSTG